MKSPLLWADNSAGGFSAGAHSHESTKIVFSCLLFLLMAMAPGLAAQERQRARALTLAEAVEIATKESETIGIARAGIESARGEQRRARSEFFPQLSGSASYTRTLETQFAALSEALIAGMIPVAIGAGEGADFRAPLGRAVIGGVITSTLLTLLVIPTVYEILDGFREWLAAKFWRRFIRTHPEPVVRPAASPE